MRYLVGLLLLLSGCVSFSQEIVERDTVACIRTIEPNEFFKPKDFLLPAKYTCTIKHQTIHKELMI